MTKSNHWTTTLFTVDGATYHFHFRGERFEAVDAAFRWARFNGWGAIEAFKSRCCNGACVEYNQVKELRGN
jgi:hypothetical protein